MRPHPPRDYDVPTIRDRIEAVPYLLRAVILGALALLAGYLLAMAGAP